MQACATIVRAEDKVRSQQNYIKNAVTIATFTEHGYTADALPF